MEAQVYFLKTSYETIWNESCFCAALLSFWFQTDLAREGRQRRQLLLTFLSMVTRWSRSTSNFYAPGARVCSDWSKFWQVSSCEKFMQHHETCLLIAEGNSVLCKLVMFITVFFHWMYKIEFSCYQQSSVMHVWFVYWVSGWEMRRLWKSETPFWMASPWLKSLKRFWPYLTASRSCISNGKLQ